MKQKTCQQLKAKTMPGTVERIENDYAPDMFLVRTIFSLRGKFYRFRKTLE
jgi:hypothetical protein